MLLLAGLCAGATGGLLALAEAAQAGSGPSADGSSALVRVVDGAGRAVGPTLAATNRTGLGGLGERQTGLDGPEPPPGVSGQEQPPGVSGQEQPPGVSGRERLPGGAAGASVSPRTASAALRRLASGTAAERVVHGLASPAVAGPEAREILAVPGAAGAVVREIRSLLGGARDAVTGTVLPAIGVTLPSVTLPPAPGAPISIPAVPTTRPLPETTAGRAPRTSGAGQPEAVLGAVPMRHADATVATRGPHDSPGAGGMPTTPMPVPTPCLPPAASASGFGAGHADLGEPPTGPPATPAVRDTESARRTVPSHERPHRPEHRPG